jgi:glyoxylase-like metal-dependent hydrolase (beta-lactamase superfamily II)
MTSLHSALCEVFMNKSVIQIMPAGAIALALSIVTAPGIAQQKEVEYISTPLSDTVTMVKGRGGNIAISAGTDGVYVIDDQMEPLTGQLLAAINKISDQPIRFVINTHYHGDHVGGNEAIGKSGAVIIAHDNIRKRMSTEAFNHFWNEEVPIWPEDALPVVTFNDQVTLHLNGEAAVVYHVPRGHTDGDAIVHFPVSNVVHMGDIYFNGLYPFIDLDGGGNIQGMIAGAELGLSLANEETRIIPGHGPLSDKKSLAQYRDFLVKARDNVQALVDQGLSLEQAIAATPTAEWDEILGQIWITPAQLVTFIYNSLKGIQQFTRLESESSE